MRQRTLQHPSTMALSFSATSPRSLEPTSQTPSLANSRPSSTFQSYTPLDRQYCPWAPSPTLNVEFQECLKSESRSQYVCNMTYSLQLTHCYSFQSNFLHWSLPHRLWHRRHQALCGLLRRRAVHTPTAGASDELLLQHILLLHQLWLHDFHHPDPRLPVNPVPGGGRVLPAGLRSASCPHVCRSG